MNSKAFHLPYHQANTYWLSLLAKGGRFSDATRQNLQNLGFTFDGQGLARVKTGSNWVASWQPLADKLGSPPQWDEFDVALTAGEEFSAVQSNSDKQTPASLQKVAESMWLGDALKDRRVMCYLQPVVASRDDILGYESFARVRMPDGAIVAGGSIVTACRALGMQNAIDRHLQIEAIKTFAASEFTGYLFINFFPGFIQRPSVYLEGLSETVKEYRVEARHIVLDITEAESARDMEHIKSVCAYGRTCGYSIALDDISSLETARKLISAIQPDFVKIDRELGTLASDPAKANIIRQITGLAHSSGSKVIAEGIETEADHMQLKAAGVDYFQGYLFSPPVPVEAALKQRAS